IGWNNLGEALGAPNNVSILSQYQIELALVNQLTVQQNLDILVADPQQQTVVLPSGDQYVLPAWTELPASSDRLVAITSADPINSDITISVGGNFRAYAQHDGSSGATAAIQMQNVAIEKTGTGSVNFLSDGT